MDERVSSAVLREARSAGIRAGQPVSTKSVRRRRRQLYLLVGIVVVGIGVALAEITTSPEITRLLPTSTTGSVVALVALIVAFCTYCMEKEVHLRRLEQLLSREREYSAEVTGRLGEFTSLLEAGRAVNSALDLQEVLDTVLTSALALFTGAKGSVSLVEGSDELVCVSAIGNPRAVGTRARFGEGIIGRVGQTREPVIIDGRASPERFPGVVPRGRPEDSAMSVPLIHRDRLLGVLNVSADGDRRFTEYDLRLLCLFAAHATSGIVHTRMHAEDGKRVEALVRLEQSKTEFVTGVSHDLRTPLTSILGCTTMARRADLAPGQRDELLEIAETQSRRLAAMVERLLLSAELGRQAPTAHCLPLDVTTVLATVVARHADAGRNVALVTGNGPVVAFADEALLVEAVGHLVDNALLHGSTPVRLAVAPRGAHIAITVSDAGPGIPAADRERVFERFVRLDANRSIPGIGLGLSIARAIVGAMGGSLEVEDGPGEDGPGEDGPGDDGPGDALFGACFTMELQAAGQESPSAQLDDLIPAQVLPALRLLQPGAA